MPTQRRKSSQTNDREGVFVSKQGRKRIPDGTCWNFSRHLIGQYSLFVTFLLFPTGKPHRRTVRCVPLSPLTRIGCSCARGQKSCWLDGSKNILLERGCARRDRPNCSLTRTRQRSHPSPCVGTGLQSGVQIEQATAACPSVVLVASKYES